MLDVLGQCGYSSSDYSRRIFLMDETRRSYVVMLTLNRHHIGEWNHLPQLGDFIKKTVYMRLGIEIAVIYWAVAAGAKVAGEQMDLKGWRRTVEALHSASNESAAQALPLAASPGAPAAPAATAQRRVAA